MTEIVNLRRARKAKRRADADVTAAANRLVHGRTRGERVGQAAEADRARRLLDGAQLDRRSGSDHPMDHASTDHTSTDYGD